MGEGEARQWMAIPKIAAVASWERLQVHKGTTEQSFGVLRRDQRGVMQGMVVTIRVRVTPVPPLEHWVFSLSQTSFGIERQIYQLDIRKAQKVREGMHAWHHEHIGDLRIDGPVEWSNWTFAEAKNHFLDRVNLEIEGELSHPDDFRLEG